MSDTANSNSLNISDFPIKATASLATKQYYGVIVDTSNAGQCVIAGANAHIFGVLQNEPAAGEVAQVRTVRGVTTKAVCGAAVSVGDRIVTDSSGMFIPATSGTLKVVGIALTATSASGEIFEMLLADGYIA